MTMRTPVVAALTALMLILSGCESTLVEPASIGSPPYTEFAHSPEHPVAGDLVFFEAETSALLDGFSQPVSFNWSFGDGHTAQGGHTSHTFSNADTYTITLVTTNVEGIQTILNRAINIQPGSPGAPPNPDPPDPPEPPRSSGSVSFSTGMKLVGEDIPPGTYRTRTASEGCYWERRRGVDVTFESIIVREYSNGPALVDILSSDRAFYSNGCARWTDDLQAITDDPAAPFGEGVFLVGVDIATGQWKSEDTGRCSWARLSGFRWVGDELIDEGFASNTPVVISIHDRDKGFVNSECGNWTWVGPLPED